VFQNLIGNAIKYRRPESPDIHISAHRNREEWVFCVRDNGLGFDMTYADRIFEPFERLHTKFEIKGTGIGLPIVKRLIERHGGRVWAESQPSRGSAFYFTLPSTEETDLGCGPVCQSAADYHSIAPPHEII
jgi:light-regulated signal transduction histidine kinase (bacteriophytochrome)